ncbi:outer membrane beta-barrel family protein [Prevotella falsenii]
MEEIVVKSDKPITRIEGDALVTMVKGTLFERLGNAKDVITRLPGVISNQGGIEVFGKGAPVIYINGRKVNNDNLLEQLKSNKIKKVEVVTNPGARYDATVKAVIRITAEREQGEGFAFDTTTKLGYRDYLYGSEIVNMNYRINKLDIFADLEYSRSKMKGASTNLQNIWLSSLYMQNIDIQSKERSQMYDGRIGFNYMFSPSHSLGLYYKVTHTPLKVWGMAQTKSWIDNALEDESNVSSDAENRATTHNIDGYYTNAIGKWLLDATFDVLWKKGNTRDYVEEVNRNTANKTLTLIDDNNSRMFAGELHLSRPLWKGQLRFGTEYSNSRRDEHFFNVEHILASNVPLIKENNTAVYVELLQRLGKIIVQLGTRYEHINSNYYQNGQRVADQSRIYNKFFPTAMLVMPIGESMLQLSYAKKYNRPLYSQLSGTISYVNRYLYESGNPLLRPSYIDNVSLNARYSWAMMMVSYMHTTDKIITSAIDYGKDNATLSKKMNSAYNLDELQLMVQLAPQFKRYYPALMVGVVAPFYKEIYKGEAKRFNKAMGIIRFNNLLVLSSTCMLNVDLSWRGKGNGENIDVGQTWQINAGATKQWGQHWKMKFAVNDIFNTARKNQFTFYSGVREFDMEKLSNTRAIECTVSYSFNATKSKYKGKGAGNKEKERL